MNDSQTTQNHRAELCARMPRKSCGAGLTRISWKMQECEQVGREIHKLLPATIHSLLGSAPFLGKVIASSAEAEHMTPTAEDIKNNYAFLKPIVRMWSDKVPSQYALADVFLILDKLFDGNLLHTADSSKTTRALDEVARLKPMLGYLRHLARKAGGSYSEEVADLKSLVQKRSPKSSDEAESQTSSKSCDDLMETVLEMVELMDEDESSVFLEMLPNMGDPEQVAEILLEFMKNQLESEDIPATNPIAIGRFSKEMPIFDKETHSHEEWSKRMARELFGDSSDEEMVPESTATEKPRHEIPGFIYVCNRLVKSGPELVQSILYYIVAQ